MTAWLLEAGRDCLMRARLRRLRRRMARELVRDWTPDQEPPRLLGVTRTRAERLAIGALLFTAALSAAAAILTAAAIGRVLGWWA